MREYYPLLIIGAILGVLSTVFLIAYASMKDKKEAIGFDRNMKDSEIIKRLLAYAKPYYKSFIAVFVIMLFSISYDIISPSLVGNIEEMIKADFELNRLYVYVAIYASILVVSLVSTYIQAIILQKTVLVEDVNLALLLQSVKYFLMHIQVHKKIKFD